jgi:Cysteine-rich CPXCG
MSMLDEVQCPYCGEPGEVAADYDPESPGDQVFVQDCEVCCNPWTVTVHVAPDGEVSVDVARG